LAVNPESSLSSPLRTLRILSFVTGLVGTGVVFAVAWLPPQEPVWFLIVPTAWLAVAAVWLTVGRRARRPLSTLMVGEAGWPSAFIVPASPARWTLGGSLAAFVIASTADQIYFDHLGRFVVDAGGLLVVLVVAAIGELRRSDGKPFRYHAADLRRDGLRVWHSSRRIVVPWSAIGPYRNGGEAVGVYGRKVSILINQPEQVSVVRGRLRTQVTSVVITPGMIDADFLASVICDYVANPSHREDIGTPAELDRLAAQFRAGTPSAAHAK
jgi:hypothetical protein